MNARLLPLFVVLALFGCSEAAPVAVPGASVVAEPTVTATGRLQLHAADGVLLSLVNAWTASDIDHVVLTLTGGGTPVVTTIPKANMFDQIVFSSLKQNKAYSLLAQAYNTPGSSAPIDNSSVSAPTCTTAFNTSADTAATIGPIALQLTAKPYSGGGGSSLAIAAGALTNPAGAETAGYAPGVLNISTVVNTSFASGNSGDTGLATAATLSAPRGVTVDTLGNLYIADTGNNRVRMVCGTAGTYFGTAMTAGKIYAVAGNGTSGFAGDGSAATGANLASPYSVAADGLGTLYIVDRGNSRIRKVSKLGIISTIAGNGTGALSGDGGLASAAQVNAPSGVSLDGSGNLYVADTVNQRIRMICLAGGTYFGSARVAGNIYSIAGSGAAYGAEGAAATSVQLVTPSNVACDPAGNVVVADQGNGRVRMVCNASGTYYGVACTAGNIYTLAGTASTGHAGDGSLATAASVKLTLPAGVAVDSGSNLYITEGTYLRKVVAATGIISTLAGTGTAGSFGDGGAATSGQLSGPFAVAVDGSGNLFLAESGGHRIRKLL